MTQKHRPDSKELIKQAAYKQFLSVGFNATTYQSIADACGLARTNIQYHFPNKTVLALTFIEDLLISVRDSLEVSPIFKDNKMENLFLIGQVFFAFLLDGEGHKKFALDLFSSRALTGEILSLDYNWGLTYLGLDMDSLDPQLNEDIIFSMGGFYELLYHSLSEGKPFNVYRQLSKVLHTIMEDLGMPQKEIRLHLRNCKADAADIEAVCRQVSKNLKK